MEKSPIAIALLSMLLVRAVNAQIDTTRHVEHDQKPGLNEGPSSTKQSPSQAPQLRTEDRIVVEPAKLPGVLRKTLTEGMQFRGWENSTIYFNRSRKLYELTLTATNSTRTYYFDETGRPVADPPAKKNDDQ